MVEISRRLLVAVPVLLFCSLLGFGLTQTQTPIATEQQAGLAGSEVCANCHVVEDEWVQQTAHHSTGAGCEGCHGAGKAHADAMEAAQDEEAFQAAREMIFAFDAAPPENAARCLDCHRTTSEARHFNRSEHQLVGVSCQTCHSAHLTEADDASTVDARLLAQRRFFSRGLTSDEQQRWLENSLLRKSEPDLCYTCHATVKAQFALPAHHRVTEGLMTCTDCHNPHGSRNMTMLRKTNWEGCVDCHAEKRGPYVFEHAAVEVEGCASCHAPHGSVNANLLLRREGRFLCLQCHVDPHAPNVPHGRLTFTTRGDCTRCHVAIHGSNHSPFFLD